MYVRFSYHIMRHHHHVPLMRTCANFDLSSFDGRRDIAAPVSWGGLARLLTLSAMSPLTTVRPVGLRVSELGESFCVLFRDGAVSSLRLDVRDGEGRKVACGRVLSSGVVEFNGVLRCGSKLRSCHKEPSGLFLLGGSVFSCVNTNLCSCKWVRRCRSVAAVVVEAAGKMSQCNSL